MAKFRLSDDSVLTIGGNAITCATDITFSEDVDTLFSDCDDANGYKEIVTGGIQVTGDITFELEADDVTVLGYVAPKTSGALVCQPNGTTSGDIKISSTALHITNRTPLMASRTGLSTARASFACSDLTIAANT